MDGVPRSYRDVEDLALQAARYLKERNPLSEIVIRNYETGEVKPIKWEGSAGALPKRR